MQQLFSKDIQLLIKATEAEIDMFAVATEELQNSFFRLPDAQIAQIQGICEASESLGGPPEAFDLLKLRG